MRLALRRGASASATDGSAAPTAAFAGLFDGHLLWVAVPARPGRLALRSAATGEVLDLPTDDIVDQPAYLGARIDLAALDGTPAQHEVVWVPPGRTEPIALRTEPLPTAPVRPSADGRTRHLLLRTPDGILGLRTTTLPDAAGLLAVRKLADAVELTLVGAGPRLALLTDDEQVLVSWPVDEQGVVTIAPGSIDLEPMTRPAMTGGPGDWRPVRRRANDLTDPRAAAPLPQIDHPDADRPWVRFPWSREALLQVRVFTLDETRA